MDDASRWVTVVIDVQNDFCHVDGAMARLGHDISANEAMVMRLPRFLASVRALGVPVVYATQVTAEATTSPARRRRMEALGRDPLAVCAEDTWRARIHNDVLPAPGDDVVVKHRYSAMVDTTLPVLLRSRGATGIVLVGTAANVCVDSTARDAYMRYYEVLIVPELVGYTDRALALPALENLGRHFARLVDAVEVGAILSETSRAPGQR